MLSTVLPLRAECLAHRSAVVVVEVVGVRSVVMGIVVVGIDQVKQRSRPQSRRCTLVLVVLVVLIVLLLIVVPRGVSSAVLSAQGRRNHR